MKPLPPRNSEDIEQNVLNFWQTNSVFDKSLKNNKQAPYFSFYDGPPFANGLPHFGHSLVTSIKDSILRYKTMRGYYVPRRNGWDCHGLPVEYEIEKKLQISGKKQITEYGIDKFNAACEQSIFTYKDEWEKLLKRLGRWSDYDNYYATVDKNYTESVWWALSQIDSKGLLYRDYKSSAYCSRCETPLSNFEVNDGYKDDITDPSLYVMFKLSKEDAYLLAWTTTPWTLPANSAVAVSAEHTYVYAKVKDNTNNHRTLIVAKECLGSIVSSDYEVIKEVAGKDLVGLSYNPLFKITNTDVLSTNENLYKVWPAKFVDVSEGTGVLHVAPCFGEDDLSLAKQNNIPVLTTVDGSGKLMKGIGLTDAEGKFFKQADKFVIEYLTSQNLVYLATTIKHTYPFCWRCDTPLMYYAISSWFIAVSRARSSLITTAEEINWTPTHIKKGRFGKWLEGARDWAISRNRYWGAPLPIWVNTTDESDYIVIKSIKELSSLSGRTYDEITNLHRPDIDSIEITKDGKIYRRVSEVIDCWFESGCMSIAQWHYPFENEEVFKKGFPADFIVEGLDQTRLWFYVQHVIATILFEKPAFKNVIVNGMILAADGQKLSKRLRNYPPIEDVFSREGADSLRYYLLSSPASAGEYFRFTREGLTDVSRNVIDTLYNSASFFTMYAAIDGWQPSTLDRPKTNNVLDRWLLANIDNATRNITRFADSYDVGKATRPLAQLVDDLSNWYIRRSRRRFWKSENDLDKEQAYQVLYYGLITTIKLFAPWCPFISDYLWDKLTSNISDAPSSVHLTAWPKAGPKDDEILSSMKAVREIVTLGLSARAQAKIKVRQPLQDVKVVAPEILKVAYSDKLLSLIEDELNVKQVILARSIKDQKVDVKINTQITGELREEGISRDLIRFVQQTRKKIGLAVEDRIDLKIYTSPNLMQAFTNHKSVISSEVLAKNTTIMQTPEQIQSQDIFTTKIEGIDVSVSITKLD